MPLEDFHDDTFVAFTDISGFKQFMKENRAAEALNQFYSHGYSALREQPQNTLHRVEGLFVSDCAVLWVRSRERNEVGALDALLAILERMNRELLGHNLMLKTSVAFGLFHYNARNEFQGIEKNLMHGSPYLDAFLDTDFGKPKLEPGQCRILHKNVERIFPLLPDGERFSRLRHHNGRSYFYWMCRDRASIEEFEREYTDAYQLKFGGMLRALKRGR